MPSATLPIAAELITPKLAGYGVILAQVGQRYIMRGSHFKIMFSSVGGGLRYGSGRGTGESGDRNGVGGSGTQLISTTQASSNPKLIRAKRTDTSLDIATSLIVSPGVGDLSATVGRGIRIG